MFKKVISVLLVFVIALAAAGCGKKVSTGNQSSQPENQSGDKVSYLNTVGTIAPLTLHPSENKVPMASGISELMVSANNALSAKMLGALDEGWTGVFSPVSLQIALELLSNGGDEATAQKLLDAVCPGMTREDVNTCAARLVNDLAKISGVTINNAVVVNNAYMITTEFANIAADYYRSSVGALSFKDPQSAISEINNWISNNTQGLIKNMFDNNLGPDVAIILLNAMTLNLSWEKPFNAVKEVLEFKGYKGVENSGAIVSSGSYNYGSFDQGEMVIVPYEGGEVAMAIILPAEGQTAVQAASALIGRYDSCKESSVMIKMPKIDTNSKLDILAMSEAMGIRDGIQGYFPNLVNDGSVAITQVLQRSVLNVNENGTIASTATAVVGTKGAAPAPADISFICDRPYAMVIYQVSTGMALYVSIINDI